MATEEILLAGVKRRKVTGQLYFEMRFPGRHGDGKFCSTKIRTVEEGGLCYDIAKRYSEFQATGSCSGGERGKRKAPLKLNYPGYSPLLTLEDLPSDFDIQHNKEGAMEIILKQAQAAAKDLPKQAQAAAKNRPKSQKHPAQVVGSQSIDNRSSPHQNAYNSSPRGAMDHQDLAGVYRSNDVLKFLKDVSDYSNQCCFEYKLKVTEREELERKVKDIKEDLGIISFPKSGPDKFHEHMACLKQLFSGDGKVCWPLEVPEQAYKSEESKCWELRKVLEDHNLKSIPESLVGDGNKMMGRRRANEKERLPQVLEICPTEEQNRCSMPIEVSACSVPPASPPVDVNPHGENNISTPSVEEMHMLQPVVPYECFLGDKFTDEDIRTRWNSLVATPIYTGYRRENEDERPADVCVNNNNEMVFSDHWSPDWTDALFSTDEAGFQS